MKILKKAITIKAWELYNGEILMAVEGGDHYVMTWVDGMQVFSENEMIEIYGGKK